MLLLVAAGVGLAWFGAESVRARTVQVETISAGSGATIKDMDGVFVEYEGRLKDGTVFDSSAGRGAVPMVPAQVIPGFREALSKMQAGGRYRVSIPSRLAYGAEPPPGAPIPPNADLEFDVHVTRVLPDAGLMMQQMQQMQGAGAPPQ
jgi:FKBP-type peptidyl-prolyl cis-trans isomerase FkpA